ncbi:MAG: type II toxin-antitoxin system RelE/ParE family toxin [Pseudomonadota bacterium]|nr:type II toxin-antitoxin system RelE/ParE family toxin [Pseudomonadota bacterium]
MSAEAGTWTVRLAGIAESDFESILLWTLDQFGDVQTEIYSETLAAAVQALSAGPEQPGTKARPEIGRDLFTLHVARNGRRGRHFVLFRVDARPANRQIDVLRILHDSMDLARHVPEGE